MKPADRHQWITQYLRDRSLSMAYSVNVCDRYFVDDYIEHTNAKCAVQVYGAPKCPQLGLDLSAMHKAGQLTRVRTGLGDMHSMGFPSWVWDYKLAIQPKGN
jgi:hypothetical protein